MKNNIDIELFKILYEKYEDYILPIVIILTVVFLIVNFTVPQIKQLSSLVEQRKIENEKLSVLRNNFKILTELDNSALDSQLQVVSDALPSSKDFASILSAVSISADKAGVFLGDYEFEVGDLSNNPVTANFSSLELTLIVSGESKAILRFVDQLYMSIPVSEVLNLEMNNNRSTITIVFYYKQFSQKSLAFDKPIAGISQKDLETISTVSSWNNPRGIVQPAEVGSPSATISPF